MNAEQARKTALEAEMNRVKQYITQHAQAGNRQLTYSLNFDESMDLLTKQGYEVSRLNPSQNQYYIKW